jgi:hypothetical protein
VLRIFEKKTVRKIGEPMKDECLGIQQGEDNVKPIKSL